jgi:hypothetical protein
LKDLKLNSSIEVARKGLLNIHRKNRKLSMMEKDNRGVSISVFKKDAPKQQEDVELVLPSLSKNRQAHMNAPELSIKLENVKPNMIMSKSSRHTQEVVKPK